MATKPRFIISDLHLGAGHANRMEDFDEQASENFVTFFNAVSRLGGAKVVLNGDFIDFPQIPLDSISSPPLRFLGTTEAESTVRLQKVLAGHREECEAIKDFLSIQHNELLLIPGNHDIDFAWNRVLRTFMKHIGASSKNFKFGMVYKEGGVYVTHGHQYSDENQIDVPINFTFNRLNSCWGTHFVEQFFNTVEELYPLLDNARPMWKVALSAILHEELLVTAQFVGDFLIFLKNFRLPLKDFVRSSLLGWQPTKTRTLRQRDIDALTASIHIDALRQKIQELRENPEFRRGFDSVFEGLDNTQWEQVFVSHGNTEQELLGFVQNAESRPRSRALFSSKPDNYQQAAEYIARYHHGTRVVIMGHTHEPVQDKTLQVKDHEDTFLYYNTGTWTKTYRIPWWKLPGLDTLCEEEHYTPVFNVVRCTGEDEHLDVRYFEHWRDAVNGA